ncbi:MAG: hypothetical protein H7Z41_19120 [Cytophagales bacterium]|nr:hypothetical protein [Armatimonadota bacterium]
MIKRLIALGVFALVCGAGMRFSRNPAPVQAVTPAARLTAPQDQSGDGKPRWEPLWTRPAPGLTLASVAADGTSVAWIDRKRSVRRLDSVTGNTVWQTEPLPGMSHLVAVPGGDVLVYSPLNRLRPVIRVLDRNKGAKAGAVYPLNGAVWSVAAAGGGSVAFVGTGQGTIYTLPIRRESGEPFLRPTTWTVNGIPEQLVSTADGSVTFIGGWGNSNLSSWQPTRPTLLTTASVPASSIWQQAKMESFRTEGLCFSGNGTTAVALSSRGRRGEGARLDVFDGVTGNRLWQEDLNGFGAKARVSRDGQFIAVTYAHLSEYNTGRVTEQKLSLFTREGRKVFGDRGGIYFSPELAALSANGSRITVQSGPSTLFTLDNRGRFKSKLTLPKDPVTGQPLQIRRCVATEDGRFLLMIRGDGLMTLYKATAS